MPELSFSKASKPQRSTAIKLAAMVVMLVVVVVTSLSAQDSGGGGDSTLGADVNNDSNINEAGEFPTLERMFMFSPIINSIILALSGIALLWFVFLLLTVSPRSMAPPSFVDELTKLAIRGKHEQATDLCRSNRGTFIATIVQRCMENAGKPTSVIMNIIDSEGRRRADLVWNRASYLADIANVAPMLGLLGTVIGMIEAFFLLEAGETGSVTSATLSSGVGKAMSTTMFGLGVAILALFFHSIIKSRATVALAEAEQAVHSVADHIKRIEPRPRGASGPPPRKRPGAATDEHDL